MAAAFIPLEIEQGATDVMQFKFIKDGQSLNIRDVTFVGAIKASVYDSESYPFRFDKVDDFTVNVYLDASISESMDFTKGVYDIKMIQIDGFNTRLVQGPVTISLGVTDETNHS